MESATTHGIKISVETFFQEKYSKPEIDQFVFSYRITIENLRNNSVQLLSREWLIKDASGARREVQGDGVIGKQPIIAPGGHHQYVSWCPLSTTMGIMQGNYLMKDLNDHSTFQVTVPAFKLTASFLLN